MKNSGLLRLLGIGLLAATPFIAGVGCDDNDEETIETNTVEQATSEGSSGGGGGDYNPPTPKPGKFGITLTGVSAANIRSNNTLNLSWLLTGVKPGITYSTTLTTDKGVGVYDSGVEETLGIDQFTGLNYSEALREVIAQLKRPWYFGDFRLGLQVDGSDGSRARIPETTVDVP